MYVTLHGSYNAQVLPHIHVLADYSSKTEYTFFFHIAEGRVSGVSIRKPMPCGISTEQSDTVTGLSPSQYFVFPVSVIPIIVHNYFKLHASLIRLKTGIL